MLLDATTESLRAYMGGAATTTNPYFVAVYADHTTTTFAPGNNHGQLNGATPVTVVAAPAPATQRQVKFLSIFNADTIQQTVAVELYDTAPAQRTIVRALLQPGEQLIWSEGAGWVVLNAEGAPKMGGVAVRVSRLMKSPHTDAANLTAVLTITSTNSFCLHMGVCPFPTSLITMRYRVTTAAATITWAEVAVYKGPPVLAGNPTLTRLGWQDVSGVINSTGQKSTNIALATPAQAGDDLWLVLGDQATTTAIVRGALADDLQSGGYASAVFRPSLSASVSPTLAGAAAVIPWWTCFVN